MNTFLVVVLVYVVGVFAAREVNRRVYLSDGEEYQVTAMWWIWLLSWMGFLAITIAAYRLGIFRLPKLLVLKSNWFTGRDWKKKEGEDLSLGEIPRIRADEEDYPEPYVFTPAYQPILFPNIDDLIIKTRLDILRVLLSRLLEQNCSERFTGLCYILRSMQIDGLITVDQEAETYEWLKAKYNPDNKLRFWWPRGALLFRINAIEDCITEEEGLGGL